MARRGKRHTPTDALRAQVKAMSAFGIPQDDIAVCLDIDAKTLRRHYREELDKAEAEANAKVAESLFKKATGNGPQSVTAAISWLKTRAQWKDTTVHELTGKDGAPLPSARQTTIINDDDAARAYRQMVEDG